MTDTHTHTISFFSQMSFLHTMEPFHLYDLVERGTFGFYIFFFSFVDRLSTASSVAKLVQMPQQPLWEAPVVCRAIVSIRPVALSVMHDRDHTRPPSPNRARSQPKPVGEYVVPWISTHAKKKGTPIGRLSSAALFGSTQLQTKSSKKVQ